MKKFLLMTTVLALCGCMAKSKCTAKCDLRVKDELTITRASCVKGMKTISDVCVEKIRECKK